jgi:hypothetical protein
MAKNHILEAVKSIAAAQEQLDKTVEKHGKIIDSQGKDIAMLEKKIVELRNHAIHAEIANGVPTKVVASKYDVTPSRVSQIAPRNRLN